MRSGFVLLVILFSRELLIMTQAGINRRRFMGAVGVMTGTVAISRAAPSPNEQVGIAVLGCGRGANLASWF
ncbi:MAG: twin-arginine translocation signal domain-containing protein, partial [Planctomycetaceae bacterium]|nr:twin-arginine translocation signal domain-containing protein [Planctomycetaceae bacterium]